MNRTTTIAARIASLHGQFTRCQATNNTEWKHRSAAEIDLLVRDYLPHGSGVDNGVLFDYDKSRSARLVFNFGYHFMDDNGFYDGWGDFQCVVTADIESGYNVEIKGRNRRDIKDYLHEIFSYALGTEIPLPWTKRENKERAFTLWIAPKGGSAHSVFPFQPVHYQVS